MRAFQVACVALATASASALSSYGSDYGVGASYYGSGYGLGGASYSRYEQPAYTTGYTQAPVSYGYAAAPALATYGYSAAAAPVSYGYAAAAAPVSYGYAPAIAAPVSVKSHEIHTTSGRQAIRIEDVQSGDQVIRVHEGPQAGPQISQIRVPGEQHHVRVINHQAGPAEVQRVVRRQETQVFDVQKPGRPGARIVQVVKGESPAPSVEFVNAGGSSHHVYHANDAGYGQGASYVSAAAAPVTAYSGISGATYGASYGTAYPAAAATYTTSYAAPSYSAGYTTGASYGGSYAAPSTYSYSGSAGYGSSGSYGSTAVISKA